MNDTAQPNLLFRTAATVAALTLALGVNAVAAYTMGGSGTPAGRAQPMFVADLGTAPVVTVKACRLTG